MYHFSYIFANFSEGLHAIGAKKVDWIIESLVIKAIKQSDSYGTRSVKLSDRYYFLHCTRIFAFPKI